MKKNIDVLAEIQKSPRFPEYYKEADIKIRLSVAVYNKRKELNMSQQQLAKKVRTTQKIISKIESADVNLGVGLMSRIMSALDITINFK